MESLISSTCKVVPTETALCTEILTGVLAGAARPEPIPSSPKEPTAPTAATFLKRSKPVNFFDTFLFQFINPKGVIVAMITVSTFIDVQNNYLRDALIVLIVYFFMAVFSVSSWCLLGKYLRNFATNENFIKKFNYTMSFLLIVCVIMFYV